ncbi:carboxylate--amine ligase [Bacillus canaveralius]|uniref:Carboxylate--amine ligase n=1 Tax=Bacillus canaveralius TaxID=1403243 RepID=A0A2N5GNG3_9BACI|nr:carboxylate--amine ligase [Bacillus canaveralius]PLR84034.1 carboxylate--amine ligase [Bacillus canaveralius]PLR96321.1 carboxylate--amine ligase [Bacillus canaveralius]
MEKILITDVGVAPAENVIKSWNESLKKQEIIGVSRNPINLYTSKAETKRHIPYEFAFGKDYKKSFLGLLEKEKPSLAVFMNDREIFEASKFRDEISATGTKLYMPRHEVIKACTDKYESYKVWQAAGIKVPKTMIIRDESDLKKAFNQLGNQEGKIWLRSTIGAGGRGALPTNDYDFAKNWIDIYKGWGSFTGSELLQSDKTVTWLSVWYEGELVVAQTRRRKSWGFGNRTLSGVTGITGVGETYSSETVDRIAMDTIFAIDKKPHGVYGVDMTYDQNDYPNPTEINMRFFTTCYFFTEAGLNMPEIYKDIVLYQKFPYLQKKVNPLPDGLLWIRDMDREPILTTQEEVSKTIQETKHYLHPK